MASRGEITSYAEYVAEKKTDLLKLHDLYEEIHEEDVVPFGSKAEERILIAQYYKLRAELRFMKSEGFFQTQWLPNDPDFLYEWAKYKLKIEIKDLQKTLQIQAETYEQLVVDERELLEMLAMRDHYKEDEIDDKEIEGLIEMEKYKSDVVHHLHRKLVRRLKRLARFHLSSSSTLNTTDRNFEKSFYKVLQKFVVELRHNSSAANLSGEQLVVVDESIPKEHLQFLFDCKVIEIIHDDPLTVCLKRA